MLRTVSSKNESKFNECDHTNKDDVNVWIVNYFGNRKFWLKFITLSHKFHSKTWFLILMIVINISLIKSVEKHGTWTKWTKDIYGAQNHVHIKMNQHDCKNTKEFNTASWANTLINLNILLSRVEQFISILKYGTLCSLLHMPI